MNNSRTVLYITGSVYIELLPYSDCQILKLFTKLFRILLTDIIVLIFYTICFLNDNYVFFDTKLVQLWGMKNDYLQEYIYDVACFFPSKAT